MAKQKLSPDNESFKDQRDILREINSELGQQIDNIKSASKAYSGLESIALKLQNNQEDLTKLNKKQLTDLKSKASINLRELKDAAERLLKEKGISAQISHQSKAYKNLTDKQKALVNSAKDNFSIESQLIELINQRVDQEIDINKKLGVTGSLLKGISKIPIIGNLIDTNKALDAARDKIKDGGGKVSSMSAAFKNLGGQLKVSLLDPLTIISTITVGFIKLLSSSDEYTGNLAKEFNISYKNASNLRTELQSITKSSKTVFVTTKGLQESLLAIGSALGSNAKLNKDDLITFTKLREMAGYTNEELVDIQKLTLSTGGNLKDNIKSFLGTTKALASQNGLIINEKQLLKEVSKTSASIKLSIGGTTEQLAKAAFQAKQFGINLDQADKIASSLLDFESSITNELEAELITGKNLNLEKARLLALNGDIAGSSAEILKQVGGTVEFSRMNRIQQEAIAKAVGLSRDELSSSLIEREALNKLSDIEGKNAQEKYETLVKQVGLEEAKKRLGNDALASQLQQNSNAEKFQAIIEKIKDAFIPIAEEILPKINSLFQFLGDHSNIVLGTMTAIASVIGVNIVGGIVKSTMQMIPLISKAALLVAEYVAMAAAWAVANPITALAGLAVAAGVGAVVYSQIKDGMIDPKGGLVVSGEKGTYKLDSEDHIIAGTDLGKSKTTPPPINQNNNSIDITPLILEIKEMKLLLSKILDKEGNVYMDSSKVGTTFTVNSYKTQ